MEVKAVAFDSDDQYDTRAEAEAADEDFLAARDTRWDDREAIVFLNNGGDLIASFEEPDRYWLSVLRINGEDGYTVASRWTRAWLPNAAAPTATPARGAVAPYALPWVSRVFLWRRRRNPGVR